MRKFWLRAAGLRAITWGAPTGAYGLRAAAIAKRYAAAPMPSLLESAGVSAAPIRRALFLIRMTFNYAFIYLVILIVLRLIISEFENATLNTNKNAFAYPFCQKVINTRSE